MRRACFGLTLLWVTSMLGAVPATAEKHPMALSLEEEPRARVRTPKRPRPLLELGEPFLGVGKLSKGWTLPTGAVWRPQLIMFGNFRSAFQAIDQGDQELSEWVSRLDLHTNLRLTGTERLLVSFRPMNDDAHFSGYSFKGDPGWHDGMNMELRSLFFEGEIGELFPGVDTGDRRPWDVAFSVGRQPWSFQDGMLVDDVVDGIGLTKNTMRPGGTSNLQVTFLHAWDELTRQGRGGVYHDDASGSLTGLTAYIDLPSTSLELGAFHVDGDEGDGLVVGVGATQRLGRFNSTLRLLASYPDGADGPAMSRGELLFSELSWTPRGTHDVMYANGFLVEGRFTSAARDREKGGPVGRTGILFEAAGMGRYGSALSSEAEEAFGFSFGWQKFLNHGRRQFVLELGGRRGLKGAEEGALAIGSRFQQALGRRTLIQLDGFVAFPETGRTAAGARLEFQVKF
jgi:hypothetical protein